MAAPLKTVHDWVAGYQQSWSQRFEQLDEVLAELKAAELADPTDEERRR